MSTTKWLGLWHQPCKGYYAGQVIKKSDIPAYTRIVMRVNKFYHANDDTNRPRFVFCFADSKAFRDKCVPLELADDDFCNRYEGGYFTEEGDRLYTAEDVYDIIHGMEEEHGLSYGDDLIEDFI